MINDIKKHGIGLMFILFGLAFLTIFFSNYLNQKWEDIFLSFGVGFLFSGIVDFLILRNERNKIINQLENEGYIKTKVSKTIREFGLKRVYEELSDKDLYEYLKKAQKIKIIKTWFHETKLISDGLNLAIKNNAEIDLYLLHPKSILLEIRSNSATGDPRHGIKQIYLGLTNIMESLKLYNNTKTKVYLYDEWPGAPIIKLDARIFVGFYMINKSSPEWPWLEFNTDSKNMGEELKKQFKKINPLIIFTTEKEIKDFLEEKSNWLKFFQS